MGSQTVRHDWATFTFHFHCNRDWGPQLSQEEGRRVLKSWGGSVLGHLGLLTMLCYAKSLQSCLTLCDPIDGSPPGSAVPEILQARILEWVAISFSNAWKRKVKVKSLSRVLLLATPWTAAYQAPLSMDFPGKSTGVGCHCLSWPYPKGK